MTERAKPEKDQPPLAWPVPEIFRKVVRRGEFRVGDTLHSHASAYADWPPTEGLSVQVVEVNAGHLTLRVLRWPAADSSLVVVTREQLAATISEGVELPGGE